MLRCEICNGELEIQVDGVARCIYCGIKYSKESLREKIQGIQESGIKDVTIKTISTDFDIRGGVLQRYNGSEKSVVIPDNVVEIGQGAFANCPGIINITIPTSVKRIYEGAFYRCESLECIVIPDSVVSLSHSGKAGGMYTFQDCVNLKEVTLSNNIKEIPGGSFCGCKSLSKITFPNGITDIGDSAFKGCESLEEIIIPDNVIRIGEDAFKGCVKLRNISLSENLEIIPSGAFYGCKSLESIYIPVKVKGIATRYLYDDYEDEGAFEGCINLKKVNGKEDPFEDFVNRKFYVSSFGGTPIANAMQKHIDWQNKYLCRYCGGKFDFWNAKVCKNCGKNRDY